MDTAERIAAATHMLNAAYTLIVGITGSIRDIPVTDKHTKATVDTGIAIEMLDAALDQMIDAVKILEAHAPHPCDEHYIVRNNAAEDAEPHGSRDTFAPAPLPECPACGNILRFDAECRCAGCGNG